MGVVFLVDPLPPLRGTFSQEKARTTVPSFAVCIALGFSWEKLSSDSETEEGLNTSKVYAKLQNKKRHQPFFFSILFKIS